METLCIFLGKINYNPFSPFDKLGPVESKKYNLKLTHFNIQGSIIAGEIIYITTDQIFTTRRIDRSLVC